MQWINTLLQEYGQTLGMDNLAVNDAGTAALVFSDGDELIFEQQGDSVTISLLHQSQGYDLLNELKKALQLCHYEKGSPIQVQLGLLGEKNLSLSVYLQREQATTNHIDSVILHLRSIIHQTFR